MEHPEKKAEDPGPYHAAAKAGLGLLADLAPSDQSMVDELIAQRLAEAPRQRHE